MEKELKDIITELKSINIAERHLSKVTTLEVEYTAELLKLENEIRTKCSKIESLSKLSVTSLYHRLVGDKNKTLELLKKHYLQLSLRFNEIDKSLKNLKYESSILESKIERQSELRETLKHKIQLFEKKLENKTLNAYRKVVKEMTIKLRLMKEIDEAIDQAVIVNKKFNGSIRFIKSKAQEIYNEVNDQKLMYNYNISNLSKYQDRITSLKHSLIKLEIEINDVYVEILKDKNYTNNIVSNFVNEYRMNLITDLTSQQTLNGSFVFLKNYKAIIMSMTKSLRSDLKKLKKELEQLEDHERNLLENI